MFLCKLLLSILPFQNEEIPQGIEIWDHRGPETELTIETLNGDKAFFIAALSDSYENQILNEIGIDGKTFSVAEWKQAIQNKGYKIIYSEVRRELACFDNLIEIRKWLEPVLSPTQIEQFLWILQNRNWVDIGNGKIGIPYKRLVLIVEPHSKEQWQADSVHNLKY